MSASEDFDGPPNLTVVDGTDEDPSAAFLAKGRLLVASLYRAITTAVPLAVHPNGELWLYDNGVYRPDRRRVAHLVASRLDEGFKPDHLRNFASFAEAMLSAEGRELPTAPAGSLVCLANGMLDPFSAKLHPHDPDHLAVAQWPVSFDRSAKCPIFDTWFKSVLPDHVRRRTLLEDAGMVLDLRGHRQKKAPFLIGPKRSGKSTFVRIVEALVGHENRSTEELLDLATNRFRVANLFGRPLNVASDITSAHTDVATFKKLTGGDSLTGERKFGHPFSFRFNGLFLFTMNEAPSVDDPSGAYRARVRPYRFSKSFAGHEDPSIEAAIIADELPGVLNLLLAGLRRVEKRNGYATDATTEVADRWFSRQSDRIALFLSEATRPGGWTKRKAVYEAWQEWSSDRARSSMTRRELYAGLRGAGVVGTTIHGYDGFELSLVGDYDRAGGEA